MELVKAFGDDVAERMQIAVVGNFGASSTLAKQIEAGAPCDLFLSADPRWVEELNRKGLLEAGTRRELMGNDLVLVVPRGRKFSMAFDAGFDFAHAFQGRLAVGDPTHVPAGTYARQALERLGWWGSVEDRLLPAGDVGQALRLVERGEADAGIVYATDVIYTDAVEIAGVFPSATHEPIRYEVAGCHAMGREAKGFLSYLESPAAHELIVRHGFQIIQSHGASATTSSTSP